MATSSITHDIVIDNKEDAEKFVEAITSAEILKEFNRNPDAYIELVLEHLKNKRLINYQKDNKSS